jgi:hypothetical protein
MPNLGQQSASQAAGARKGFWTRWMESIAESRMRQIEHEMGLHGPVGEQKPFEARPPQRRDDTD